MSSPLNRFRIPGGGLDLDLDDEHQDGTGTVQVGVMSSFPVYPVQPITHLTPEDLSGVLCRVSHPLASKTAEYVRALNLSGNAFRNLDLAALNVLANNDSTMADQLVRIRAGVLPCSLLPEPPTQEHDGPENEFLPLDCEPPPSSPPPTSIAPETPASPSWKEPPRNGTVKDHSESAGHDAAAKLDVESDSDNELADLIALENDGVAAPSTGGNGSCKSDLGSCIITTPILSSEEISVNPPAQRSERGEAAASSCNVDPHSIFSDHDLSVPNQRAAQACSVDRFSVYDTAPPLSDASSLSATTDTLFNSASHSNAEPHPDSPSQKECDIIVDGISKAQQTTGAGNSQVDPLGNSVHVAETEAVVACNLDSDDISESSQARGSSDGPTAASGAASAVTVDTGLMEADRRASTPVAVDGGFSSFGQSGAISRSEGLSDPSDPDLLHSPTHVLLDENASKNSADVAAEPSESACTSNAIVISLSPSRDIVTLASGSSGSVLETSPETTTSDPVDESLLELDLLDFSPFSFSTQFGHSAQMPLPELFEGSAYSPSTGTDLTCEDKSEYRIDSGSDESRGITFCPKQIVLAHMASLTPLSLAAESRGTSFSLRNKGAIEIPLRDENSKHDDGDGSPVFMDAVAADEDGATHADANHVGGQTERAIDFLWDLDEGFGTCDDKDLTRPNSSFSVRPIGWEEASHADGTFGPASKAGPHDSLPSPRSEAQFPTGPAESMDIRPERIDENSSSTKSIGSSELRAKLRPPLLGLAIPISGVSLQEELFQLSPLFSPSSETSECSKFGRLFSESSFSVPRTQEMLPVKLKRGSHLQRATRPSRGTDTSDLVSPPAERILIDASIQTDEDREVENLRRRVKALERDLRSFRATIQRSEDRVNGSKPKSFWKKVASTDRVVPAPEPVNFSLLKLRNSSSLGSGVMTSL